MFISKGAGISKVLNKFLKIKVQYSRLIQGWGGVINLWSIFPAKFVMYVSPGKTADH